MKFLIIDDSDVKIKNIKEFIKGHEVDIAQSYVSGMYKLATNQYDGLILDMAFPQDDDEPWKVCGSNGLCVLSEMNRKKLNIPVIIYSSGQTDVSEYKNVKGYILHNNTYIGDKIKDFINLCETSKQNK